MKLNFFLINGFIFTLLIYILVGKIFVFTLPAQQAPIKPDLNFIGSILADSETTTFKNIEKKNQKDEQLARILQIKDSRKKNFLSINKPSGKTILSKKLLNYPEPEIATSFPESTEESTELKSKKLEINISPSAYKPLRLHDKIDQ